MGRPIHSTPMLTKIARIRETIRERAMKLPRHFNYYKATTAPLWAVESKGSWSCCDLGDCDVNGSSTVTQRADISQRQDELSPQGQSPRRLLPLPPPAVEPAAPAPRRKKKNKYAQFSKTNSFRDTKSTTNGNFSTAGVTTSTTPTTTITTRTTSDTTPFTRNLVTTVDTASASTSGMEGRNDGTIPSLDPWERLIAESKEKNEALHREQLQRRMEGSRQRWKQRRIPMDNTTISTTTTTKFMEPMQQYSSSSSWDAITTSSSSVAAADFSYTTYTQSSTMDPYDPTTFGYHPIAYVVGAHGVYGWMKIRAVADTALISSLSSSSSSSSPTDHQRNGQERHEEKQQIQRIQQFFCAPKNVLRYLKPATKRAPRPVCVLQGRRHPHRDHFIIQLEHVQTREEAQQLRGATLYLRQDQLQWIPATTASPAREMPPASMTTTSQDHGRETTGIHDVTTVTGMPQQQPHGLKQEDYDIPPTIQSPTQPRSEEYYDVAELVGLDVFLDGDCEAEGIYTTTTSTTDTTSMGIAMQPTLNDENKDNDDGGNPSLNQVVRKLHYVGKVGGIVFGEDIASIPGGLGYDYLELLLPRGSTMGMASYRDELVLIPFVPKIVTRVDLLHRELYIDPPRGLLDLTYIRQEKKKRIKGFLQPATS